MHYIIWQCRPLATIIGTLARLYSIGVLIQYERLSKDGLCCILTSTVGGVATDVSTLVRV